MIESADILAPHCFGEEAVKLGPLEQVNFVFGPNGSGKTTISRALAKVVDHGTDVRWALPGAPLGIRVYNRDYVAATIKDADQLPGVFLLGTESKEAREKIEALTGPGGAIRTLETELRQLRATLGDAAEGTGKLGEMREVRQRLTEAAWRARSELPVALEPMFKGTRNNRARFLERFLEVAKEAAPSDIELEDLVREAKSVFDETATEFDELAHLKEPEVEKVEGFDLLDTAIVGSSAVGLAPLIEELENSDWVAEGRKYFERADGRCPFCQQQSPPDLVEQLRDYFDDRFVAQMEALGKFVAWYDSEAERLRAALAAIESSSLPQLDSASFDAARTALEAILSANSAELLQKQNNPSIRIKLQQIADGVAAVNAVVDAANRLIRDHNVGVRSRATATQNLIEKGWRYFVHKINASELAVYQAAMPSLEKAKASLEARIDRKMDELRTAEHEVNTLKRSVRSSKPIIDEINNILSRVGFENFRLAVSPRLRGGYALERSSGEFAAQTLSEGERTFITFLYFYHQLIGEPDGPGEPRDLVAVIDDPISSLDSDVLFVVSGLIKELVSGICRGTGRLRQIVVLTHNAYFHREVAHVRPGARKFAGGRAHFVIRKRSGQASELVFHGDKNPIMTAYRRLWDEVRVAQSEPWVSPTALQNIMRRIIENYFRVMGGIDESTVIANFSGEERLVCSSLFSWLNEGSHLVEEELDYSPTEVSRETFLRVFAKIFEQTGHSAHYEMMMASLD